MTWTYYSSFDELTPDHLYEILKLRQDIFIIEQNCIYDDIDGLDRESEHLLLHSANDCLIGYLRIVPPQIKFDEYSLGRIAIKSNNRGIGLGKMIVEKGIEAVQASGARDIRIEAQAHLVNFYENVGFRSISAAYDIDGIPHLQMILNS